MYPGLTVKWNPGDKTVDVPTDTYRQGCVVDAEDGLTAANKIGFPVMIKASEGGGGKGIRKSNSADGFANLFRQVREQYLLIGFWIFKEAGALFPVNLYPYMSF